MEPLSASNGNFIKYTYFFLVQGTENVLPCKICKGKVKVKLSDCLMWHQAMEA